jgi:hypothetical protein
MRLAAKLTQLHIGCNYVVVPDAGTQWCLMPAGCPTETTLTVGIAVRRRQLALARLFPVSAAVDQLAGATTGSS